MPSSDGSRAEKGSPRASRGRRESPSGLPDKVLREEGPAQAQEEVSDSFLARQRWLQARDVELLRFVHDWECAGRDQLVELFFPSVSTANRRLALLVGAGFLERAWPPREDGAANCRRPGIYLVDQAGLRYLKRAEDPGLRASARERSARLAMAPHALEVVGFFLELRRAALAVGHRLATEECLGPRRLRREVALLRGHDARWKADIVPDAYLVYERERDRVQGFFLELDRGRERSDPFVLKANGYKAWHAYPPAWRHLVQGARESEGRFVGRFPPVLVVTTTERRMSNLLADVVAAGSGPISWYFTYWDKMRETAGGVLGRIWRKAPAGEFSLLDLI